jgi:hypothetical protein
VASEPFRLEEGEDDLVNDTCGACGGPAMLMYGIACGQPGTYTVCLSENCDKITKVTPDAQGTEQDCEAAEAPDGVHPGG